LVPFHLHDIPDASVRNVRIRSNCISFTDFSCDT
jgi:hypothetical protein